MQYINNLILDGYTYIFIPKGSRSRFFASKANRELVDNDVFDEFKLTTREEKEFFRIFDRDTFIKIWG